MTEVIIIGAGVAGLMAAHVLDEKGKQVLVLEARNRLGGRIITTTNNGWPLEGGAEFIHGSLPNTRALFKRFDIKVNKTEGETYRVKSGFWQREEDLSAGWDLLIDKLNGLDKDITIEEFLDTHFPNSTFSNLKKSFRQYIEGYDAADIKKISSFSMRNEMNNENHIQFRPVSGYSELINSLAQSAVENGARIQLSSVVTKIEWVENKVTVHANDKLYIAAKIIITLPVSLLAADAGMNGPIQFIPPIPDYQRAANQIGYGGVIKILLTFRSAFWFEDRWLKENNLTEPFFILGDTTIPTWWTQYPNKSPVLTGWIAGPHAHRWSQSTDDQILAEAMQSLCIIFNKTAPYLLNALRDSLIYNWINDPFALGAYSYHYVESSGAQVVLKTPLMNTLYFSGEALADSSNFGTVEGAILSAKTVVKELLQN